MKNILFIIDEIEFKYFEFNVLVTDFWMIKTYLEKGHNVDITTKKDLFIENNLPYSLIYKTNVINEDIVKSDSYKKECLNRYDVIFMRSDPPVDIDFINATYVLDLIDTTNTVCLNSSKALRNINEKLYINKFPSLAPKNIVASNPDIIKEFLFENGEIIIKPLNKCFSSGVFYLNREDKNIDGEILDYAVTKVATNNDFKFNEHKKENLILGTPDKAQKKMGEILKDTLSKDGIYMAGLDVIDNKIIEINITSPCFFINEINSIYNINFEKILYDKLEKIILEVKNRVNNGIFAN